MLASGLALAALDASPFFPELPPPFPPQLGGFFLREVFPGTPSEITLPHLVFFIALPKILYLFVPG